MILDTNILISACWKADGLEARVVGMVLAGAVTACVNDAVWAEYMEVSGRGKFAKKRGEIAGMLEGLGARGMRVGAGVLELGERASDDDDNRFLECAVAAGADYLITGNLRDYPGECRRTRVVNAREFLNALLQPGFDG